MQIEKKDTRMETTEKVIKRRAAALGLNEDICWTMFQEYLRQAKVTIPAEFSGQLHSESILMSLSLHCRESNGRPGELLAGFNNKSLMFATPDSFYTLCVWLMKQVREAKGRPYEEDLNTLLFGLEYGIQVLL